MKLSTWLTAQRVPIRRAIALSAGPVLALLVWVLVIRPVIQFQQAQQRWLAAAEASIARDRGLREAEGRLRQQLAGIEKSALFGRLYPDDSRMALATSLQADVGALLSRCGLSAQSIAPLLGDSDDVLERAGVRVVLVVTIDQLKDLLAAAQASPRLIRVEEMTITAPQLQMRDHNPQLTATLVFFGFRLRHGSPVPRASSTPNARTQRPPDIDATVAGGSS